MVCECECEKSVCIRTSGAIQKGVPTNVFRLLIVSLSWAVTPKSPNFTLPSVESRMFAAAHTHTHTHTRQPQIMYYERKKEEEGEYNIYEERERERERERDR